MSALVRELLNEYYELGEAVLYHKEYVAEHPYWTCDICGKYIEDKEYTGKIFKECPVCGSREMTRRGTLQTYTLEDDLLSNIDVDLAMEHLREKFTEKEWRVIDLLARGFKTTDEPEILQVPRNKIYKIARKISESIANHLGYEYSDNKLKRMIKSKLKVKTLTKTQNEFIKRKLNMSEQHRKTFDFITIYNVRFDDTGRMGAFCPECKKFAVAKKFMCVHMKRGER